MAEKTEYTAGGVEAVDRALAILSTFDTGHARQSLAALAQRTGFYKSTILRLLSSLLRAGYLQREADGSYVLGPEPLRLAAVCRRASTLESRVRPILRSLLQATDESASFFRREGNRRQCLYREETRRAIRDHVMEGDMLPLDVGAAGRVLTNFAAAKSAPAQRARLMAALPTISMGERDPETAAIAAPVFSQDGLVGALTISGPRARLTRERLQQIGPILMQHAQQLTALLGGDAREHERPRRVRRDS